MEIIDLLSQDNYLMYNIKIASTLGVYEAIIIGELARKHNYWRLKDGLTDGFFFITQEDIKKDTGLSEYQQRTAIKSLVNEGVLEVKKVGLPSKNYYKILNDKLLNILYTSNENIKPLAVKKLNTTKTITTNTINTNREEEVNKINPTINKIDVNESHKESHESLASSIVINQSLEESREPTTHTGPVKGRANTILVGDRYVKLSSKNYLDILLYIDSLDFNESIKELLRKYFEAFKGRFTISQIIMKLEKLKIDAHDNAKLIEQAIENSFINSWASFYIKDDNKKKSKVRWDGQHSISAGKDWSKTEKTIKI